MLILNAISRLCVCRLTQKVKTLQPNLILLLDLYDAQKKAIFTTQIWTLALILLSVSNRMARKEAICFNETLFTKPGNESKNR